MNRLIRFVATVLVVIVFVSCNNKNTPDSKNIKGLWQSIGDVSTQFGSGADEVAIHINKDSTGALTAQGFFLKHDEFVMRSRLICASQINPAYARNID